MVREVRVYVEGGGDQRRTKRALREGMGAFLDELRQAARSRRVGWEIVACGGRGDAYSSFCHALEDHVDAFNVLLVDAERPVKGEPWAHVARQPDGWQRPADATDDHCHLMVQAMEAWIIADREALREFYGRALSENVLPANPRVEEIPRDDVLSGLRRATKGKYAKGTHGPKLLGRLRPDVVRDAAPHCERLFATVERHIAGSES